jgi:excisionase family DNA binding protein
VESPYMTVSECAVYLRSTPGSVYQWVHKRKIPFRRLHGKLLFLRSELDQMMEHGAAAPVASISKFQSVRARLRSLKTESTVSIPAPHLKEVRNGN